jgi:hypothetical protein
MADLDPGSSADGTPAMLRKDDNVASQRFGVIPAITDAGKVCYYLANSGKYLNTSPFGSARSTGRLSRSTPSTPTRTATCGAPIWNRRP